MVYLLEHIPTNNVTQILTQVDQISNQREEYNSLELNVGEDSIHSRDETYLEPVSDAKAHYEEVISLNETTEQISQNISEQTEDGEKASQKLQSCYFSSAKRYTRPFVNTNSL